MPKSRHTDGRCRKTRIRDKPKQELRSSGSRPANAGCADRCVRRSRLIPSSRCKDHRFANGSRRNVVLSHRTACRYVGCLSREIGCAWWSQTGSNRRPQACKASALPTELWPRSATQLVPPTPAHPKRMVGPGRVELPTSRLSGVRSNHLSYGPDASVRPMKKEKRRRRKPPL